MLQPKISLGQNFLHNPGIADKIALALPVTTGPILEIGSGNGALTKKILQFHSGQPLTVVEIDADLIPELETLLAGMARVITADIRTIRIGDLWPGQAVSLLGNLPYHISKEIIDWMLSQVEAVQQGVFLMQREFVDKLFSVPDSKIYNAQAIAFQHFFSGRCLFDVQPGSFRPPPKVVSTVFFFSRRQENLSTIDYGLQYYDFLKCCFHNRRKTLLNNLQDSFPREIIRAAMAGSKLREYVRAEQCSVKVCHDLFLQFRRQKCMMSSEQNQEKER